MLFRSTWGMTIADVEHNIKQAGFVPVRRNMRYDHLEVRGTPPLQAGV